MMTETIMDARTLDARARAFLKLSRIAVAGVSNDPARHPAGNAIFRRLKALGGQVFAVNPTLATFEGEPCYPDLASIPDGVDGVVIVTSPGVAETIVRQCPGAGVRHVWMHESSRRASSVSPAAVDFCRDQGIEVIPGACPMMFGDKVDFGHRCMRWMLKLPLRA